MKKNVTFGRKAANIVALVVSSVCAAVGLFFLFFILFDVLRNGISSINWQLFVKDSVPPFSFETGGLRHAFLGQGLLTLTAVAMGIPLGILGGTFLAEYGRHLKIGKVISSVSDIAVSMPSIVIGTFVYAILVKPMQSFNGWAGAVALAIIMLPVVVRTTEDMMRLVPWTLREAAFALGAPYYKVILQIVYRSAASGILTGILLAVARIVGETAPLLFTSFNNNFFSLDMNRPMASLTVTIYQYASSPFDDWVRIAWAGAFVITCFVLILNIVGRVAVKWRYGK
ncbi:MAG: phosphate ABC transporter permease PstA [Deferribacteraceae bacterium]|jgi:phosphate transport system permease protein|nr:phosphate ABC transporter permease PstA [Deferribacteraceae bacterium]